MIYNRLKMGEPLGIDATIRFALDNWTEPLTDADLETDSPYNTRTNQGLPPGTIGESRPRFNRSGRASGRHRCLAVCGQARHLRRACLLLEPGRAQPQRREVRGSPGGGRRLADRLDDAPRGSRPPGFASRSPVKNAALARPVWTGGGTRRSTSPPGISRNWFEALPGQGSRVSIDGSSQGSGAGDR